MYTKNLKVKNCDNKDETVKSIIFSFFFYFLTFCCPLQVREEYAHFLSCICTPQKKRYSDFSSTNPSSSQSRVSMQQSLHLYCHMQTVMNRETIDDLDSSFNSCFIMGEKCTQTCTGIKTTGSDLGKENTKAFYSSTQTRSSYMHFLT